MDQERFITRIYSMACAIDALSGQSASAGAIASSSLLRDRNGFALLMKRLDSDRFV
jgi:hypothetical protein